MSTISFFICRLFAENFLWVHFFVDQVVMAFNAGHTGFQRLLALASCAAAPSSSPRGIPGR
jgi:hypothetical protein